jgi:ABC-type protease/lipase transport system fused ATPase/permease subunit
VAPSSGPQYYIPLSALAPVFVATVLLRLWRWQPLVAVLGALVLVVLTVLNAIDKVVRSTTASARTSGPGAQTIEEAHLRTPALVFVETDPGPYC